MLKVLRRKFYVIVYNVVFVGEFGVVYRGQLTGWRAAGEQGLVAVKTLKGMFFAICQRSPDKRGEYFFLLYTDCFI